MNATKMIMVLTGRSKNMDWDAAKKHCVERNWQWSLNLIDKCQKELINTIDLYKNLQMAKDMFVHKLEKGERFGTFLRTDTGYDITAPEGYVAITEGEKAVKLVDRLSFSTANFNVSKNWVDGDTK